MKNIVLARVDDRLIHGQVLSGWVPHRRANAIMIIDDEIAKDKLTKRVLKASVPGRIHFSVCSVDKAVAELKKEEDSSERILLLAKSPIFYQKMYEAGCEFTEINLGGMGMYDDRKPFFRNISCTEEELESLHALSEHGVDIYYQLVPDQKRYEIKNFTSETEDA